MLLGQKMLSISVLILDQITTYCLRLGPEPPRLPAAAGRRGTGNGADVCLEGDVA